MKAANYNPQFTDEGICQYGQCGAQVPDEITMRLCDKHLGLAYAAFLIRHDDNVAEEPTDVLK